MDEQARERAEALGARQEVVLIGGEEFVLKPLRLKDRSELEQLPSDMGDADTMLRVLFAMAQRGGYAGKREALGEALDDWETEAVEEAIDRLVPPRKGEVLGTIQRLLMKYGEAAVRAGIEEALRKDDAEDEAAPPSEAPTAE